MLVWTFWLSVLAIFSKYIINIIIIKNIFYPVGKWEKHKHHTKKLSVFLTSICFDCVDSQSHITLQLSYITVILQYWVNEKNLYKTVGMKFKNRQDVSNVLNYVTSKND